MGSRQPWEALEQERSRTHQALVAGNRTDDAQEVRLSGRLCLRLLVLMYEAGGEEQQTLNSRAISGPHSLHSRAGWASPFPGPGSWSTILGRGAREATWWKLGGWGKNSSLCWLHLTGYDLRGCCLGSRGKPIFSHHIGDFESEGIDLLVSSEGPG